MTTPLLISRRFLPLFATQFLGAFNDNLFKNALVILITYRLVADAGSAALLVNLAAGVFILPFLLISPLAGRLADRYDRARIARQVKLAEIALAMLGGAGMMAGSLPLLLLTLFGFGIHSAFFGPVKYALLPQLLDDAELPAGNAYVSAATFMAILLGTIVGGLLAVRPEDTPFLAGAVLLAALVGYGTSRFIPAAKPQTIIGNVAVGAVLHRSLTIPAVRWAIIGISWFWFIGALLLAQLAPFAHDVLQASGPVVTFFLALFSIGVALGSVIAGRIVKAGGKLAKPGRLAPMALAALSLFLLDLARAAPALAPLVDPAMLATVAQFMQQPTGWRIAIDLFLLAVCGGLYSVPLYTLLQRKADKAALARSIAANNWLNAAFMVAAAVLALFLLKAGLTIPQLFLIAAGLNLVAAFVIGRGLRRL